MSLKDKCIELEHYETPEWAARAILKVENFPPGIVIDPCFGTGVLAIEALVAGYPDILAMDIHDYGFAFDQFMVHDFLKWSPIVATNFSIFMNPPFSKACEFVEKSMELGARKIVCFQRFAWWEAKKRRAFWEKNPPSRVYICGNRATCWRHDIPESERVSGTTTAHAWFVWEKGAPPGTLLGHIWKDET